MYTHNTLVSRGWIFRQIPRMKADLDVSHSIHVFLHDALLYACQKQEKGLNKKPQQ